MMNVVLVLCALLCAVVLCDIPADKVGALPNYDGPINFDQYAGYITVDQSHGRALFYWFVESQNDPSSDPVVLWLNGGPGCSSLDGFFYEHGPFHFDRSGTGNIFATNDTLHNNPVSWNKVANMIYLESPAGVGYSYSNTSSDYRTNDNKTAQDSYTFLENFFAAYPEFLQNDFYIAGESYGGIYVPTLAYYIHEQNQISSNTHINLKGILVGNGVTDEQYDAYSFYQFAYNHALYSPNLYNQMVAGGCLVSTAPLSCLPLYIQMQEQIGNVNIYDIYKGCYEQSGLATKEHNYSPLRDSRLLGSRLDPPCINNAAATQYLNLPQTRAAVHAMSADLIGPWEICSDKVQYKKLYPSVVGAYEVLAQHYRILVYSGDSDGAVPYVGTLEWIRAFEQGKTPLKDWVSWTQVGGVAQYNPDGQVAGYVTQYDNLNFITIKGAGHMVPQYKPVEAFAFFSGFLAGSFP